MKYPPIVWQRGTDNNKLIRGRISVADLTVKCYTDSGRLLRWIQTACRLRRRTDWRQWPDDDPRRQQNFTSSRHRTSIDDDDFPQRRARTATEFWRQQLPSTRTAQRSIWGTFSTIRRQRRIEPTVIWNILQILRPLGTSTTATSMSNVINWTSV